MTLHDVLQARRTLSRLKRGVPPATDVGRIAVGMADVQACIADLFEPGATPRWRGIQGEYGEGKSFLQALSLERALAAGYAVASLEVNKDDGALHQPQRHLSVVLKSLRSPLPGFDFRQGLAEVMRHWLEVTPRTDAINILNRARAVTPWSPAGLDPERLGTLIRCLSADQPSDTDARVHNKTSSVEVVWDDDGNAFAQAPLSKAVHWRRTGSDEWEYYAPPEKWTEIRALLSARAPQSHSDAAPTAHASYFPEFLAYMTAGDIDYKSRYHRFAAAYRLQVIIEWLRAIGHEGLFLFIDEVDNVIRQIHGRSHPSCFATLAWYCSCPRLPHLRVVFAGTPEVFAFLDNGGRKLLGDSLRSQQSIRPEEVGAYERWKREADRQAAEGWQCCGSLRPRQRVELFERISSIHRIAWNADVDLEGIDVSSLARQEQFDTTRRWVRATVQLLDLLHQKQHHLNVQASEIASMNGKPPAEPWQMTLSEWRQEVLRLKSQLQDMQDSEAEQRLRDIGGMTSDAAHRHRVKRAIEESKPVPPEVRADYPDL